MKYLKLSALLLLLAGCLHDPVATPINQVKWIDLATKSDTIITNPGGAPNVLYYAIKNWKSFPDSNAANGYRQVVATKAPDSIYVALVNSTSGKYYGPTQLSFNAAGDTLKAQNFLDTVYHKPSRIFILQP